MNQETQIIEIFLNYENYNKVDLKYIFRKNISKLSGGLLRHHEYSITKKNFVFLVILILNTKLEKKIYTHYKIILKPKPKRLNLAVNIFKFN